MRTKKVFKRIEKWILYIFGFFITLLIILLIAVWINSPGKAESFTDAHGNPVPASIAEIRDLPVNGARQRLIIRGADTANPILLRVHGGPG